MHQSSSSFPPFILCAHFKPYGKILWQVGNLSLWLSSPDPLMNISRSRLNFAISDTKILSIIRLSEMLKKYTYMLKGKHKETHWFK